MSRWGPGRIVGGGAVVTHDIPDYSTVVGIPARPYRPQTITRISQFLKIFIGETMTQNVPMSSPDLSSAEVEMGQQRITDEVPSVLAPISPNLEEERLRPTLVQNNAVGVSSGTAGLHLSIIASNVSENDLVITTPFSFIASANCILYERAIHIICGY